MRLRHLLGPFLAALAITAPAAAQTPGVVPDGGIRVAIGPTGDECRQVRLAQQAGLPWVSTGVDWESLEPAKGQYADPGTARTVLRCAKDLGINTQLIITNAPAWASGRTASNDPPTPANLPAYGAFLANLAGQLAPLVDVWTPWNEPNFEMFWASPRDPVRYVALQKTAYAAIKPVDPMSRVSSGAVVGTPTSSGTNAWDYLEAVFAAGIKGSADIYLWNFYPRTPPEGTALDFKDRPAPWALTSGGHLRGIVDKYDAGKPVWITETSYATCKSPCSAAANQVTEAGQADYIGRMFTYRRRYLATSVERIFWYETRDNGPNLNDWFANQGLYRNDWSPKPAVAALNAVRVVGTTPSDPGIGGGNGGTTPTPAVPTPTLPTPAAKPPTPSQGVTGAGIRVSLSKLRLSTRNGKITLRVRANVSTGRARLRVEGYSGRKWRLVQAVRLPGSANISLRFRDRGYLGVRVLLRPESSRKWLASRVGRVPVRAASTTRAR